MTRLADARLDGVAPEVIARLTALALSAVPHRLVTRFEFDDGALGVAIALERMREGRWTAARRGTWIPLGRGTTRLFCWLLAVADHASTPAASPAPFGETD